MMFSALYVFLGSGLGGICRWVLGSWLNGTYPLGTLAANVIGCFLIGLLSHLLPVGNPALKLLFVTGFCGGFTTFSTFMNESFLMLRGAELLLAIGYISISIILGLIAAWCGHAILE